MTTTKLTLGQHVTITDYLVRGTATPRQVLVLADRWPELPAAIADRARADAERDHRLISRRGANDYRMWMPASIVSASVADTELRYIGTERRNHPTPYYDEVGLPVAGFITQKIQVQDGQMHYGYEEGNTFLSRSVRAGYWVAYRLDRRPLLVLPSMISEVRS